MRKRVDTIYVRFHSMRDKVGAATLIMSVVLLMVSTLIIIYAASYARLQDKSISNFTRKNQAFSAAQAGLEYGINYLNKNSSSILSNTNNGYLNAYSDNNTRDVTLANNSKYTITYSNPTAYNYKLIKVTSTGTSDDGTSTTTVSQLVQYGSLLSNPPNIPLYTKGSVALSGNTEVNNQYGNTTIKSASTVSLSGFADTVTSNGVSSSAGNIKSDIQQNLSSIANLSSNDFFVTTFGVPENYIKNKMQNYYSNSSNTNYRSQLNNISGTSVWIDQTGGVATIGGITVAGSSSNPVLIVVKGNNTLSGFVIIYGFLYVDGSVTLDSSATAYIIGGMVTTGAVSGPGTLNLYYTPSVLSNLQGLSGMRYYAKVPGSWKDF